MLALNFDYSDCVKGSEKVQWKLDDVMTKSDSLDFARPFLPDRLVLETLSLSLSDDELLKLNQICGNAYLNLFQFVEEYILVVMLNHAHAELFGDPHAQRALTRMVDEELKHQLLFKRFRQAFDRDFGHACGVLENASEVAHVIMSNSPIAVMLITLHIEWMTQKHYTESVRGATMLDGFFKSLLHHHWLEESQHARIDLLELDKLARGADPSARQTAVTEYMGILDAFDGLLKEQAGLDAKSLATATGSEPREEVAAAVHRSYQRTFLWYGMVNPQVVRCFEALSADGARLVAARSESYR